MVEFSNKSRNQRNSRETDQARFALLTELLLGRFEELCDSLGFSLFCSSRSYSGCCPIHGGDNSSGLTIYRDGDIPGKWICFTGKCEYVFQKTLLGFLRGVLSAQKTGWVPGAGNSAKYPFMDTVRYGCDFLGIKWADIKVDSSQVQRHRFQSIVSGWGGLDRGDVTHSLTREDFRARLLPPQYFIERGYSKEVLERFDVGLCMDPKKQLFERVIVPIFDNGRVVGMTARSVHEQCKKCGRWHSELSLCPATEEARRACCKWRHSPLNFHSGHYLYNAKDGLKEPKKVIVVEGPGCLWRLVEAGAENVVATFGSKLTDPQQAILEMRGVREVLCGYDKDEAGDLGFGQMQKSLGRVCRVRRLLPPAHDFGSCRTNQLREFLTGEGLL